jgi:hypothetical protein
VGDEGWGIDNVRVTVEGVLSHHIDLSQMSASGCVSLALFSSLGVQRSGLFFVLILLHVSTRVILAVRTDKIVSEVGQHFAVIFGWNVYLNCF